MGLRGALLRFAAARPRVLVAAAPGGTAVRLAVEAELAGRGWPVATSPAASDVLLIAGDPGLELAAAIEAVWSLVPAPRVRAHAPDVGSVPAVLDAAAARLATPPARDDVEPTPRDRSRPQGAQDHEGHGGGPGGHHGHGGSGIPGGLPMADLGEDRDALTLDRLHVALGPVLPDWPAGLVLRLTLQGDVVQEATGELLDGDASGGGSFWAELGDPAAQQLDALARLLAVAGWDDAATRARRLRDALLAGTPSVELRRPAAALVRRVRRSRTLRWLVGDIGTGAWSVADRLTQRLAAIEAAFAGRDEPRPERMVELDELAAQLMGAELAAARLIVAAADPDTGALAAVRPAPGVRGG